MALVTGASSGIGEATARMLAARGATVAMAARRADRLEALGAEIAESGGTALPVELDVSERERPRRRSPAPSRSSAASTSSSTTPA